MRDKYLRLQSTQVTNEQSWQQEKDKLQSTIQELKLTQEHLREPGELIEKQNKNYLREKNNELLDALISQERMTEKYKRELVKTAEAYETECGKSDKYRREINRMQVAIGKKIN